MVRLSDSEFNEYKKILMSCKTVREIRAAASRLERKKPRIASRLRATASSRVEYAVMSNLIRHYGSAEKAFRHLNRVVRKNGGI